MSDGLKTKYIVRKAETDEVLENCFVLRPDKDRAAVAAIRAYAAETDNRNLAADLLQWVGPTPNVPLTLEELREMDGDPVWVQPAKPGGKIPARWMLLECTSKDKDLYLFTPPSGIAQGYKGADYGKTWLAYRRKPEEGTA